MNNHKLALPEQWNSNAWIKVKLVGTLSNRSGIGAKVRVKGNHRRAHVLADAGDQHRWRVWWIA
jgi:hypothetical protein